MKNLYKRIVKSVTVPLLERCLRFLDGRLWVPVFYFSLGRQNTVAMVILHVLHNIQVKTGKRVIVITCWPFWPRDTAKDPFFTSFIRGLNPKIHYVLIPVMFDRLIQRFIPWLWRILLIHGLLYRPMGIRSTFRFTEITTYEHTDILNHGSRVAFHIPKSHEHMFEEKLKDLGVSPDDWFVCVHAREDGYITDLQPVGGQNSRSEGADHRNVDIRDYFPAIDHITSQGGVVIRMGDPAMKKVNGIEGFIDYPFTRHWNMLMDLYLVSRCRFFLGCQSGISGSFPKALHTPVLLTNFTQPVTSAFYPYSNTLFLLNPAVEKRTGRVLGLEERFQPGLYAEDSAIKFDALGYRWLPNSPEDILEASKELLHLVETNSFDRPRTEEQELFHQFRLQEVKSLWSSAESRGHPRFANAYSAESRISATFASRHFAAKELLVI